MNKLIIFMVLAMGSIFFLKCELTTSVNNKNTKNHQSYKSFDECPTYKGNDLGANYTPLATTFKLWSPTVKEVKVKIYKTGHLDDLVASYSMHIDSNGVWNYHLKGDWKNHYYTYQANTGNQWLNEEVDPYAKALGVNGNRAMIIDLADTDPAGWSADVKPQLRDKSDAIIYELHVRDLSIDSFSGIKNKGKFLSLTETNTTIPGTNISTGLSHIKEMGITHVHILPAFDFRSIDETIEDNKNYNWGYDPQNFNVPDGNYATNPYRGEVRIKEFKTMVQSCHQNGIRVIMDVVYNHTGFTDQSNFNQLVPGYYYRQNEDGTFSNASACGNETASERPMVRKFILESVLYWAKEYHIDGFRFDLMGIHDIETMNLIADTLYQLDSTILIYGEGWTAGDSPLPFHKRALKNHTKLLEGIAVFSDDLRDGIKGHWHRVKEKGFVSGNSTLKEVVKFGIVASTYHPQINYDNARTYAQFPWSDSPTKVIGYVSCHDNNTLYDKLKLANPKASEDVLKRMHKLANTIVMTSQSIPFLHMGVEMKRSKQGVENSFESPDEINKIRWKWKIEEAQMVEYYKNLIALRKAHPAFKMKTEKDIQQHLKFINTADPLLIVYTLNNHANNDPWKTLYVAFNGAEKDKQIELPKGSWMLVLDGANFNLSSPKKISTSQITVPAHSAIILAENVEKKK